MILTIEQLKEVKEIACLIELHDSNLLFDIDADVICDVCNGIGPEWFPEKLRSAVDKLHPSLIVVSILHDLRFYFGTGEDEDFKDANDKFKENGYKVAKYKYAWYNPKRYIVMNTARRFGNLCQLFGRPAYDSAIQERKASESEVIQFEENKLDVPKEMLERVKDMIVAIKKNSEKRVKGKTKIEANKIKEEKSAVDVFIARKNFLNNKTKNKKKEE